MPASVRFWSKKRKVASDTGRRSRMAALKLYSHEKTISVLTENTIKRRTIWQGDSLHRDPKFPMTKPFANRSLRTSVAMLTASFMLSVVAPSAAQSVPVPKPAPKSRDGQMSASDARGPATTGTTQAPEPVIPDPRRNVPANIFATFDANQKAQAARVSAYLSSLSTLVGNFVQVGPDGSK